jgi:hypothetical protein
MNDNDTVSKNSIIQHILIIAGFESQESNPVVKYAEVQTAMQMTYPWSALYMCRLQTLSMILSLLILFTAVQGIAVAYEEPHYQVLEKLDGFELRQYDSRIVAETMVKGRFDEAGNEGFRRIFKYISGSNLSRQSISMTAPVNIEAASEKIEMTAPVSMGEDGDGWTISFFMPSQYTLETLPDPLDPLVLLSEKPGRLIAALIYSGTWSRSRYEKKKALLFEWVQKNGLRPAGNPVLARYNSPFSLWFLRRNEVLLPVERKKE